MVSKAAQYRSCKHQIKLQEKIFESLHECLMWVCMFGNLTEFTVCGCIWYLYSIHMQNMANQEHHFVMTSSVRLSATKPVILTSVYFIKTPKVFVLKFLQITWVLPFFLHWIYLSYIGNYSGNKWVVWNNPSSYL